MITGDIIFWWNTTGQEPVLTRYDLATDQESLVVQSPHVWGGLASDGQTVVWIDVFSGTQRLIAYDISTHITTTLAQSDDYAYELNLAEPVLVDGVI